MSFLSVKFLIFFFLLIFVLRKIKTIKAYHLVLLIANIIFYAFWDVRFLVILFMEIILVYISGLKLYKTKNKFYLFLPIVIIVLNLFVFKYFNFFIESFCSLFNIKEVGVLQIILPLGISFYSFQAISYIMDIYYEKIIVEKSFIKLAVYISFFPQITSGPIVKSKDFLKQLDVIHPINKENFYYGAQLFLRGFIKKKVFADQIAISVNSVLAAPLAYNGISVIFAIIGYSIQIYCDFSGYSDMAIGLAKILGFDLGDNFNIPYSAKSLTDFWRRWHISLSTWFRDYLYIPLGGNRKGEFRKKMNLFITMLVSGIWHGSSLNYIIWGSVHGLGLIISKKIDKIENKLYKFFRPIVTMIFILITWIIFRSTNIFEVAIIIKSIFNVEGLMYINTYLIIYALIMILYNFYCIKYNNRNDKNVFLDLDNFFDQIIFFVAFFLALGLMYVGDSAFIYANF